MDIISAIQSDTLFKSVFKDLSSWSSWMSLLKAFFAIEMTDRDLDLYRECTGRETPPVQPFRELWCVSGRRGGKSFMSSIIAVYLALFHDYCEFLAPGELGSILIISSDKAQSQTILNYTKGVLHSNVVFEQYIVDELKESVTLSNGIKIEVHTCNFRSIRGRTVVTGIFDECAFWMHDGSRPDYRPRDRRRCRNATRVSTSRNSRRGFDNAGVFGRQPRAATGKNLMPILVTDEQAGAAGITVTTDTVNARAGRSLATLLSAAAIGILGAPIGHS